MKDELELIRNQAFSTTHSPYESQRSSPPNIEVVAVDLNVSGNINYFNLFICNLLKSLYCANLIHLEVQVFTTLLDTTDVEYIYVVRV